MLLRRVIKVFLCGLVISTSSATAFAGDTKQSYVVAVNHAPPYRITRSEDGTRQFSGIYIDIAQDWANRAGLSLTFVEVPFSRALSMMEAGTADIMLGPNRSPARESYMAFLPTPIDEEPKIFAVSDPANTIQTYEDLKTRR